MKTSPSQLSYPELIAEIQHLSKQKKTGTIFITSQDGHLARLVLNQGQIIYLIFNTKHRGYDAIARIQTITAGRLQFAEGIFESAEEVPLPNTAEIFQLFEEQWLFKTEMPSQISSDNHLIEIIDHIKSTLAHYIGPFSTIICEEYLHQTGLPESVGEIIVMIETVATEIDNPTEEQAFKTAIKQEMVKKGLIW